MFDHASQTFSTKEKVEILLKEYDTLRSEIIGRIAPGTQLVTVVAIVLAAALGWQSQHGLGRTFWIAMAMLISVAVLFWAYMCRDSSILARRLREIEKDVNRKVGDDLLRWETYFGGLNGFLWFTRNRRMSIETVSGRLNALKQPAEDAALEPSSGVSNGGEPMHDLRKLQIEVHTAEYNVLHTRLVYAMTLQYSAWAGVVVYWGFLAAIHAFVPPGWIPWAAVLGLEAAVICWYFNLADVYTDVAYLQTQLRPKVQKLLGIEDVWSYEVFLGERRTAEKTVGDVWALILALIGVVVCWVKYLPSGRMWIVATISTAPVIWVGFLTYRVLRLRNEWGKPNPNR